MAEHRKFLIVILWKSSSHNLLFKPERIGWSHLRGKLLFLLVGSALSEYPLPERFLAVSLYRTFSSAAFHRSGMRLSACGDEMKKRKNNNSSLRHKLWCIVPRGGFAMERGRSLQIWEASVALFTSSKYRILQNFGSTLQERNLSKNAIHLAEITSEMHLRSFSQKTNDGSLWIYSADLELHQFL